MNLNHTVSHCNLRLVSYLQDDVAAGRGQAGLWRRRLGVPRRLFSLRQVHRQCVLLPPLPRAASGGGHARGSGAAPDRAAQGVGRAGARPRLHADRDLLRPRLAHRRNGSRGKLVHRANTRNPTPRFPGTLPKRLPGHCRRSSSPSRRSSASAGPSSASASGSSSPRWAPS